MDNYQENYLIEKIKEYLNNPDNTRIQDNILLSLENITLNASDFLKIAGKYLTEFENNIKQEYKDKSEESKAEYEELKESLKENNPLKERLNKIKELYNNMDKNKKDLSNLLNED